MATKEDRTIGSGISIPQWMKNKRNHNFELDPSALSPPELEDSFMLYYRHPKAVKDTETTIIKANLPDNITVAAVTKPKADFSHHPISCQKYLQNGQDITPPPQTTAEMKIKSPGTDDGFKGEAAKCGSSIIKVASQMVSSQGLGIRSTTQNCNPEETYERKRRGSKSLPASPLASPGNSPKANRKINKYFTGAFTDVDKSKGSWILSNLLARREISQSVGQIKEELAEDLERASSTVSIGDMSSRTPTVFKAKPSELREMNFWSPTSM